MNYANIAVRCGITEAQVRCICGMYTATDCVTVFELLAAKRHRSSWRKYLDKRVRDWLNETDHKYQRPLWPKDLKSLEPTWPVTFKYFE